MQSLDKSGNTCARGLGAAGKRGKEMSKKKLKNISEWAPSLLYHTLLFFTLTHIKTEREKTKKPQRGIPALTLRQTVLTNFLLKCRETLHQK